MSPLIIELTDDTPKLVFDIENDFFEISGRSLPEDSVNYYAPVIEWVKNYIQSPKQESNFVFHFEYISTSSTKQLIKLFFLIEELAKTKTVNVIWKFDKDDDDMMQTGKRLQKLTSMQFNYVQV